MKVNFNVTNQKDVPALRSGISLPPAGQKGRIFYDITGNGIYIDDGIEWIEINTGGAGVPSLQQVIDVGNTTNGNIIILDTNLTFRTTFDKKIIGSALSFVTANQEFFLPDTGGIIPITVNGIEADNNGNIELSGGLVGTLQEVTNAGNSTNQNIRLLSSQLAFESGGNAKSISGVSLGGLVGDQVFNLPDTAGTLITKVNGQVASTAGDVKLLYRNALTDIGESINLIPATTKPVQRLIFRGTTSITGSTQIPLTGINIALILNLYGNIEISSDFRTPLNYFDSFEADGDTYRTKALLYYRSSVNSLQIVASTGIIGSESAIVSAYTVVIEFQQV